MEGNLAEENLDEEQKENLDCARAVHLSTVYKPNTARFYKTLKFIVVQPIIILWIFPTCVSLFRCHYIYMLFNKYFSIKYPVLRFLRVFFS